MKYIIRAVAVMCMFSFCFSVFAESTTTPTISPSINQQRRMEVKERVQEVRARSTSTSTATSTINRTCAELTTRIEKRIENFETVSERHEEIYALHNEKLLQIEAKLKAKGISTDGLSAHIAMLDEKIEKFRSSREKVRTALEATRSFVLWKFKWRIS